MTDGQLQESKNTGNLTKNATKDLTYSEYQKKLHVYEAISSLFYRSTILPIIIFLLFCNTKIKLHG